MRKGDDEISLSNVKEKDGTSTQQFQFSEDEKRRFPNVWNNSNERKETSDYTSSSEADSEGKRSHVPTNTAFVNITPQTLDDDLLRELQYSVRPIAQNTPLERKFLYVANFQINWFSISLTVKTLELVRLIVKIVISI